MPGKSVHKEYYRQHFENLSHYWDDIYRRDTFYGYHYQLRRENIGRLLQKAGPRPGMRVLDVGCGAGGYFPMYLDAGLSVFGVDAARNMLSKATEIYADYVDRGRVEVAVGDVEHLAFPDCQFDFVVSSGVLMYLPDIGSALAEMHRVLTPGGHAVLNVDTHRTIAAALDVPVVLATLSKKVLGRAGSGNGTEPQGVADAAPLTRSYTPGRLRAEAERAGFALVDEAGHGFGPIRLFGKVVFPDWMNLGLYRMTQGMFNLRAFRRLGFTYSLLVRKG